jgi:hypothetical protein
MTPVDPTHVWEFVDGLIDDGEHDAGRLFLAVHERFGDDGVEVVMHKLRDTLGDRADVAAQGYTGQWQRWLDQYAQRSEDSDEAPPEGTEN